MVEKFGTNGGKIWYLTSVDLMRAHARAHAHSNTSQTHAHSVGMCLGFYRPQKVLSWAENQNFKVALIFGTFLSLFHGVQYCTFGLERLYQILYCILKSEYELLNTTLVFVNHIIVLVFLKLKIIILRQFYKYCFTVQFER